MNGEAILLTQRAQQRLMVLNALDRGELLTAEAAHLLGLSSRQVRRLRSAYRARGPTALVHGNRGRPSPRRFDARIRSRLVRLARTTYAGINFQHLSELLAEREGLTLSRPSISRLLRAQGLASPRRRRLPKHRQRRERMPQAGMLVQMDGSHHAWLEGRGPALVLLSAIDDATGTVLGSVFRQREDAQGYFLLLRHITTTYGLPLAIYTDYHGIFHRARRRPLTVREQLQGQPDPTQVGRALQDLGIQWIPASSPQAKGRIERLGGTFQDRLVSELRLARIRTLAAANAFLPRFLARYNARFAHPAGNAQSAYRPWPPTLDPATVWCFKYLRTVANDNTVTLGPHRLQILPTPGTRSYATAQVEVHERLNGGLAVFYHGRQLAVQRLTYPSAPAVSARRLQRVRPRGPNSVQALRALRRKANPAQRGSSIPPADHPWRHKPLHSEPASHSRAARTKSLHA